MLYSPTALALAALTAIAHHGSPAEPVRAASLVAHYRLPARALEPVLQLLSRLHLVQTLRGAKGGYFIEKPEEITVRQIVETLQPTLLPDHALAAFTPTLSKALRPAQEAWLEQCARITVADLAAATAADGLNRRLEPGWDFMI